MILKVMLTISPVKTVMSSKYLIGVFDELLPYFLTFSNTSLYQKYN